jgi:hypothetical protein
MAGAYAIRLPAKIKGSKDQRITQKSKDQQ